MMPFYWQLFEYVGLSALALGFCPQGPLLPGVLLYYCVLAGLRAFSPWPLSDDPYVMLAVTRTELQALASVMIVGSVVMGMRMRFFRQWPAVLLWVCLADMGLCAWFGYGIFQAKSLDACLWAVAALLFGSWLWTPVLITGVLFAKGGTAIFVLASGAVAYVIASRKWVWLWTVPVVLSASYWVQGDGLYYEFGRFSTWQLAMRWWWAQGHLMFGLGLGSYQGLAAFLAPMGGNPVLLQMHNDWIQILFELGFVGLALCFWLFLRLLWLARENPRLLAGVVGIGVMGLGYHPLRHFVTQVLVVCLIRTVYLRRESI